MDSPAAAAGFGTRSGGESAAAGPAWDRDLVTLVAIMYGAWPTAENWSDFLWGAVPTTRRGEINMGASDHSASRRLSVRRHHRWEGEGGERMGGGKPLLVPRMSGHGVTVMWCGTGHPHARHASYSFARGDVHDTNLDRRVRTPGSGCRGSRGSCRNRYPTVSRYGSDECLL